MRGQKLLVLSPLLFLVVLFILLPTLNARTITIPNSSRFKSDDCKPRGFLERFVPNPYISQKNSTRFLVGNCVTVTGIVIKTPYSKSDGDRVFNVKLDTQYQSLITAKNNQSFNGGIHVEIVCQVPEHASGFKAGECNAYNGPDFNRILSTLRLGDHIQLTGIYVIDVYDGDHSEIHPVYNLTR